MITATWVRGAPGRPSSDARIVFATTPSMPVATAPADTSITNTKTGGCGGRTMYSPGATSSTDPLQSSGRCCLSRRSPVSGSSWQK